MVCVCWFMCECGKLHVGMKDVVVFYRLYVYMHTSVRCSCVCNYKSLCVGVLYM